MLQSVVSDLLCRILEVPDVVERVEVSDGSHAVLFEHPGMQIDDIPWLLTECHNVDAPGQSLEIALRANFLPESVHHVERGFVAVEEQTLETGAATSLEMRDPSFRAGLHCREEIACQHPGAIHGLKSIAKGSVHEFDGFFQNPDPLW